jgi:hypothetical protein
MVIESVNNTDVDIRKELYAGVVLTGTIPVGMLSLPPVLADDFCTCISGYPT